MKFLNSAGASPAVFAALTHDDYNNEGADLSITRLWAPFRQTLLTRAHEVEVEATSRLRALLGKAVHDYIHKVTVLNPQLNVLPERRLHAEVDGVKLSGQFDSLTLASGVLSDYKTTPVWSMLKGSKNDEWALQLNSYAWLLRRQERPFEVASLNVEVLMLDWTPMEARRNPEYPRHTVMIVTLPLMPDDQIDALIRARVALWKDAQDNLPLCTSEETWERGGSFAVMKHGKARALKLCSSLDEATAWISSSTKPAEKAYIEQRPAERIRCETYCDVAQVCQQFQDWKAR